VLEADIASARICEVSQTVQSVEVPSGPPAPLLELANGVDEAASRIEAEVEFSARILQPREGAEDIRRIRKLGRGRVVVVADRMVLGAIGCEVILRELASQDVILRHHLGASCVDRLEDVTGVVITEGCRASDVVASRRDPCEPIALPRRNVSERIHSASDFTVSVPLEKCSKLPRWQLLDDLD